MDGKGPIGKAKEEKSGGWEVGMSEVEEGGGGKVEQLYLKNSKKKKKEKKDFNSLALTVVSQPCLW